MQLESYRERSDYAAVAPRLPVLLLEAAALGGLALVRVAYAASVSLRNLGYRDLSREAARIAVGAASETEDPAWLAAARFASGQAMPVESAGTASRVWERALGELQASAAQPQARQMLGLLHLSAAMTNAVIGRGQDVAAHLGEARREADSLGDPADGIGFNQSCFGPTNVLIWRMSIAGELGESGRVLALAGEVDLGRLSVANRHQSYWLSCGKALAAQGRRDREAVVAFTRAERAAPVQFTLNPVARDAVAAMLKRTQRRAVPDDLRGQFVH